MKYRVFCAPTFFEVRDIKNPFMNPSRGIDREVASLQWAGVRNAFCNSGDRNLTIDPVADLEDMVFVADTALVSLDTDHPFVIPSAMKYPSRQREVRAVSEWFKQRGYELLDLKLDSDHLEGNGDVLWRPHRRELFAGFGIRSTAGGVTKLAALAGEMGISTIALELAQPSFFHLDLCLSFVNADAAIAYRPAFTNSSWERLNHSVPRVYEISREEAFRFVCNGVMCGDHFVTPFVGPILERALHLEHVEPLVVDTSEFEKSGGSVACLHQVIPF